MLWTILPLIACGLSYAQAPAFRMQEIGTGLNVVYAVTTGDVNGDRRPDVIAINNTQLLWFENPTWAKHVVTEKVTERDNVAIAANDIDRDGRLDFALGADWQPTNTASGGSLHWVSAAGKVQRIGEEPTLHRIRWGDIDGDKRAELIVVPLHGRGTKGPSWTDGPGARILVYRVPKNPPADTWASEVADESLHVIHNFIVVSGEIWVRARKVFTLSSEQAGSGRSG